MVVNVGDDAVLTFSREGELLETRRAAQPGGDGVVITLDGTTYVSSVRMGGVSRLRPGEEAELIATGVPNAASMCHDPDRDQLVLPMSLNNDRRSCRWSEGERGSRLPFMRRGGSRESDSGLHQVEDRSTKTIELNDV